MFVFQYHSRGICRASPGKLLGKEEGERKREGWRQFICKTTAVSEESYTSANSFRQQIELFTLIGSDRQSTSSVFTQRHRFSAPQSIFWATTDTPFSKFVQIWFSSKSFQSITMKNGWHGSFTTKSHENQGELVFNGHWELAAEISGTCSLDWTWNKSILQHKDCSHMIK